MSCAHLNHRLTLNRNDPTNIYNHHQHGIPAANVTCTADESFSFSDEMVDDEDDNESLDMLGNDSSIGGFDGTGTRRRQTSSKDNNNDDHDKTMLGSKKISNTFRWKLFVITLMLMNTAFVIIATSLFLRHESNQDFERSVSTISIAFFYHPKSKKYKSLEQE
jgi:hypothetical protein